MPRKLPPEIKKIYEAAPLPHRTTMLAMRESILEIVPKAEEVISYGMPAFKLNGKIVAGLLANKNHVGFYPFSGSVLSNFKADLAKFSQTKSALHVPIDQPLKKSLLAMLIKARISQCAVSQGKVNLARYESLDGLWRDIKLAAPARRALVDAKITKISQLKTWTSEDLSKLHGIGKTALKILRPYLAKN